MYYPVIPNECFENKSIPKMESETTSKYHNKGTNNLCQAGRALLHLAEKYSPLQCLNHSSYAN